MKVAGEVGRGGEGGGRSRAGGVKVAGEVGRGGGVKVCG